MRKYITSFVSVIFLIVILLIPINSVDAATYTYDINTAYDFESLDGPTTTKLLETIDFLKSIEDDYYVLLTYQRGTYYYKVFIADKTNTTINQSTFYYSSKTYQIVMKLNGTTNGILSEFRNYSFDSEIENFKDKFNNGTFTTYTDASIVTSTQSGQAYLLYSNIDFKINKIGSSNAIVYNGENLAVGDIIPSWYDVYDIPTINISSSFICDLDGNEFDYVTLDFSEVIADNYTYQYGIQRHINSDIIWYDIEQLTNNSYSFNEKYNGTIVYGRVLDSDGNQVFINQYTIENSELPNFEMVVTSGLANPIPNYDGDPTAEIITINLLNCYDENYTYEYSYDAKTYHKIDVTADNMVYYLNEYLGLHITFRIIDENDNLIYFTYGDRTETGVTTIDPDRGQAFYYEGIGCDLDGNKVINVKMDFSNITTFVNEYNFDVVINGVHYGEIQYNELMLNRDNYVQTYDIEIYIDEMLIYNKMYSVGYLVNNKPIQGTYDDMDFDTAYDKVQNTNINDLDLNVDDLDSMTDLVIAFLGAVSSFIATFFDLIVYFLDKLNIWIRACILSLFIIFIITRIIKVARKK